jgi:hypothetical protein
VGTEFVKANIKDYLDKNGKGWIVCRPTYGKYDVTSFHENVGEESSFEIGPQVNPDAFRKLAKAAGLKGGPLIITQIDPLPTSGVDERKTDNRITFQISSTDGEKEMAAGLRHVVEPKFWVTDAKFDQLGK